MAQQSYRRDEEGMTVKTKNTMFLLFTTDLAANWTLGFESTNLHVLRVYL